MRLRRRGVKFGPASATLAQTWPRVGPPPRDSLGRAPSQAAPQSWSGSLDPVSIRHVDVETYLPTTQRNHHLPRRPTESYRVWPEPQLDRRSAPVSGVKARPIDLRPAEILDTWGPCSSGEDKPFPYCRCIACEPSTLISSSLYAY